MCLCITIEKMKEEQETTAPEVAETPVLDPTLEIYLVRDLGIEMTEEIISKTVCLDLEIDLGRDRDTRGPQAQSIDRESTEVEIETSPAMGRDEVPAKRS